MYQPMLFLHWKQIKVALIPLVLAAFALPLASIQGLGSFASAPPQEATGAYQLVASNALWLPLFPILAALTGATLALSSWNWDHQLHHVYALSLPIPRWRYAMLKMGAGALLAALPGMAFWMSAHVAAASLTLPAGLNTYPDALALRFFLSTLVSYAVLFAMSAGTVRTTLVLVSAVLAFMIVGGAVNDLLGQYFEVFQEVNMVDAVYHLLWNRHGPLEVFSGSWMLIDV